MGPNITAGSGPRPVDRPGRRGLCVSGGPGGREAGPVRWALDWPRVPSALDLSQRLSRPKGSKRGAKPRAQRSPPKVSSSAKRRGASEASGAESGSGRSAREGSGENSPQTAKPAQRSEDGSDPSVSDPRSPDPSCIVQVCAPVCGSSGVHRSLPVPASVVVDHQSTWPVLRPGVCASLALY